MNPDVFAERLAAIPDGPEAEELRRQLMKEKTEEEDRLRREYNARMQNEYNRRVAAVLETAFAFHRRGNCIQYDSVALTYAKTRRGAPGCRRATDEFSPEDATVNAARYTVCSTFIYNTYFEAIGWRLCGEADNCTCVHHYVPNDDTVVYRWSENEGVSIPEAIEHIKQVIRPGDIFTSGKNTQHTVLYLGDYKSDGEKYVMHSWGGKYSMKKGKEHFEAAGTLRIQTIDELCFTEGNKQRYKENKIARWSMYDGIREVVILRPLRVYREADYPLTPSALARLERPGLNIVRTADKVPYTTVAVGDRITYTVLVENHSKQDYSGISITENVPENVMLVDKNDAKQDGMMLSWTVDVPAGGSAQVSWTVETTAEGTVIAEGGSVAGICSNRIEIMVGKVLSARQKEQLLKLTAENTGSTATGLAFCKDIYEKHLGITPELPDAAQLLSDLLDPVAIPELEQMSVRFKQDLPEYLKRLQIPRYWGGRQLLISAYERILEFKQEYLMAGDILVYAKNTLEDGADLRAYLYLGAGRYLCATESGITECGEEILWPAFTEDFFIGLRPARVL